VIVARSFTYFHGDVSNVRCLWQTNVPATSYSTRVAGRTIASVKVWG